jgi:poly-gamma-glutamate synthesis protein (capsule biosynthesis protein)
METVFKKQIIWGLTFFALLSILIFVFYNYNNVFSHWSKNQTATVAVIGSRVSEPTLLGMLKPNIKLAFVGDMMFDRGVKSSVIKNFDGDYKKIFSKVENQLAPYDLLFGNLEGPISDRGADRGNLYSFRFEPKVATVLKDIGFDILAVANNHIFNWGNEAFTQTLDILKEVGVEYVGGGHTGAEAYQSKLIEINGVKIAFLAFSDFKEGAVNATSTDSGISIISLESVTQAVSEARVVADLVVVAYHYGEEYQSQANNFQKKYAELAIDSGADLVIGSHPHVVQEVGLYKGGYIIYSLGNFIFDQSFSEETMQGGLLEVEVNPNTKLIEKVNLKKVLQNNKFQIESIG